MVNGQDTLKGWQMTRLVVTPNSKGSQPAKTWA